jgi:hypothetical protein
MEPRLHKEEQIGKTIASIDGIGKADAPPFFYTRLQARLDKKTAPSGSFRILGLRPVLSLAVLALLVVLNITTIRSYLRSSKTETSSQQSANGIQSFADTYNLGGSSVFTDKTTDQ